MHARVGDDRSRVLVGNAHGFGEFVELVLQHCSGLNEIGAGFAERPALKPFVLAGEIVRVVSVAVNDVEARFECPAMRTAVHIPEAAAELDDAMAAGESSFQ